MLLLRRCMLVFDKADCCKLLLRLCNGAVAAADCCMLLLRLLSVAVETAGCCRLLLRLCAVVGNFDLVGVGSCSLIDIILCLLDSSLLSEGVGSTLVCCNLLNPSESMLRLLLRIDCIALLLGFSSTDIGGSYLFVFALSLMLFLVGLWVCMTGLE